MKIKEVVEILETNPKSWTISFQNEDSIVFAWDDYRFTRLSARFDSVMMLSSKFNRVNINWTPDNPLVAKFYADLVKEHLNKPPK
ncbi:MAG: hypothetical protein AAF652_11920 [Cyanobacteria bacterium P01_C01_bin.72]